MFRLNNKNTPQSILSPVFWKSDFLAIRIHNIKSLKLRNWVELFPERKSQTNYLLGVFVSFLQIRVTCCRSLWSCWTPVYTTQTWRTNRRFRDSQRWTEASTMEETCRRTCSGWEEFTFLKQLKVSINATNRSNHISLYMNKRNSCKSVCSWIQAFQNKILQNSTVTKMILSCKNSLCFSIFFKHDSCIRASQ